jgi:hypothetical protein
MTPFGGGHNKTHQMLLELMLGKCNCICTLSSANPQDAEDCPTLITLFCSAALCQLATILVNHVHDDPTA